MTPVYQTIVDKGHGNCMQAAIASLLDLNLDEVPNFIEFKDKWFSEMYNFLEEHGYHYNGMFHNKNYSRLNACSSGCFEKEKWHYPSILNLNNLKKSGGINGYFYAAVISPKYGTITNGFYNTHAVIIDINCKIVHDPNPEYKKILKYPLSDLLKYNGIIDVTDIIKK